MLSVPFRIKQCNTRNINTYQVNPFTRDLKFDNLHFGLLIIKYGLHSQWLFKYFKQGKQLLTSLTILSSILDVCCFDEFQNGGTVPN